MKFEKGHKKIGGRKPQTPNKDTKDIREAFKRLVEANTDNMTDWLERIAQTDPDKAMKIMMDMAEYNIPKLARTEIVGEGGGPIKLKVGYGAKND